MTGKRSLVDLGPMSLQLAEPVDLPEPFSIKARKSDVEKLNHLLHDGGSHRSIAEEPEMSLTLPISSIQGFSELMQEFSKLDNISEMIACVPAKISRSLTSQSTSEIEIRLRESLLPATTLIARDADGYLSFELYVGDSEKRDWLVQKLPILVNQVGQRLNRPFQVAVFDPLNRSDALVTSKWPSLEGLSDGSA